MGDGDGEGEALLARRVPAIISVADAVAASSEPSPKESKPTMLIGEYVGESGE